MKRKLLLIFFLSVALVTFGQYQVTGGSGSPLLAESKSNMRVYLLNGLQNARISFTSDSSFVHQWYRYSEKALESEPVASQQTGNTSYITDVEDGYGYYTGDKFSSKTQFIWIINYSLYLPVLNSLSVQEDEFRCENLKLKAGVEASPLYYYTSVGSYTRLYRTYILEYSTLKWLEDSKTFVPETIEYEKKEPFSEISIDPPLQNTIFTLSGDTYAKHFGIQKSVATPEYQAVAVEAHADVKREKTQADNETGNPEPNPDNPDYGGSAPIKITFTAIANEPVAKIFIWDILEEKNGSWVSRAHFPDKTIEYEFKEEGTFKARLQVSSPNACLDSTVSYNVTIGNTELKVPKAFSPGSSAGVNDEFKVSYESLISFKCTIFNRWGNKLFEWSDPSKGWDGRVNGIYVPTGVYFYVIQYKGTDGKSRVKKGSINVLRGKT